MNNEDFVSYELALKLKELGFDYDCYYYYTKRYLDNVVVCLSSKESPADYNKMSGNVCSMPFLGQAQKWLRENWDLHIDVYPIADCSLDADGQVCEEWNYWTFDIMHVMSTRNIVEDEEQYGSYEEALSAGLSAALELIEQENK